MGGGGHNHNILDEDEHCVDIFTLDDQPRTLVRVARNVENRVTEYDAEARLSKYSTPKYDRS